MRKLILWITALAVLPSALFAQTFTGTWQGALKIPQAPNGELRIVMKISTTDKDTLKAEMYSIDQGGQAIQAESVKQSGSNVKIAVPAINGTYEGNLSSDGNTIAGTWTQGPPMPLTLVKATPTTAWTIPEPLPPPKMMDAKAKPQFEVATIKPSNPAQPGWGINVNRSGMFLTRNTNLSDLIKFAYSVHPKQIIGAPSWIDSDKFDISAKPDTPGMPSVDQMRVMLQKLLTERFSLTFHNEKRELSAYAITVAKGGAKLKKEENAPVPIPGFGGLPQRGFNVRNATISEFAGVMQAQFMEQPVVDQTGLGDTRYSFILKWTPDPSQSTGFGGGPPPPNAQPPAPDGEAPPDLFAALQQQIGLQMKMTKAQVEVMIIDKAQKPSEN
ncbi:MAG TPA: TIGR03435 family protein [Bryobacteraceae bacterium]|jgi:uncharacterized protein (TIGR03435 family)